MQKAVAFPAWPPVAMRTPALVLTLVLVTLLGCQATEKPVTGKPAPEQPAGGKPAPEQPAAGKPAPEQPGAPRPATGQPDVAKAPAPAAKPSAPASPPAQGSPTTSPDQPCRLQVATSRGGALKAPASLPRDQAAVLAVDGPPDAFTIVFAPRGTDVLEVWDYLALGRQINFLNGQYMGGTQGQAPAAPKPAAPPFYPWELKQEPTAACVVKLAGPAVFLTSALALPGWNDTAEVARRWELAKGGYMVTADDRLAAVTINPPRAFPAVPSANPRLYVGTLEGSVRLGAILSAGRGGSGYRLSVSPRGQGTTADGVELVVDYAGERMTGTFQLGQEAKVLAARPDGAEAAAEAQGKLTVSGGGDVLTVELDGRVNGEVLKVRGTLRTGVWR